MNADDLPVSEDDVLPTSRSERVRRLRERAEEDMSRLMQDLHETGELRHLYGKPLSLDEDALARALKQQGFSHPLLERRKDIDEPRQVADAVLEKLRRHRRWLSAEGARPTPQQVHEFNEARRRALEEYRAKLGTLNRAIRDYNLGVPDSLHVLPIRVDDAVSRAAKEITPLEYRPPPPPRRTSFRVRLPWRHAPR